MSVPMPQGLHVKLSAISSKTGTPMCQIVQQMVKNSLESGNFDEVLDHE